MRGVRGPSRGRHLNSPHPDAPNRKTLRPPGGRFLYVIRHRCRRCSSGRQTTAGGAPDCGAAALQVRRTPGCDGHVSLSRWRPARRRTGPGERAPGTAVEDLERDVHPETFPGLSIFAFPRPRPPTGRAAGSVADLAYANAPCTPVHRAHEDDHGVVPSFLQEVRQASRVRPQSCSAGGSIEQEDDEGIDKEPRPRRELVVAQSQHDPGGDRPKAQSPHCASTPFRSFW